jgi:hypothetical protein
VRDLSPAQRGLDVTTALAALCTQADFDARTTQLTIDASYVPLRNACTRSIVWNWLDGSCFQLDEDNTMIGDCGTKDLAAAVATEDDWGSMCREYGEIPDPLCAHSAAVFGDYGPADVWSRQSPPTTTKVRLEASVCNDTAMTRWKQKYNAGDDWGASYYHEVPTGLNVLTLNAGWNGSDEWRARYFSLLVSDLGTSTVHVGSAWINLSGKNRFTCPAHI